MDELTRAMDAVKQRGNMSDRVRFDFVRVICKDVEQAAPKRVRRSDIDFALSQAREILRPLLARSFRAVAQRHGLTSIVHGLEYSDEMVEAVDMTDKVLAELGLSEKSKSLYLAIN